MHGEGLPCRVCGLPQAEQPWGGDWMTPSFNIFDCCVTEFGYEDGTVESVRRQRQAWLASGRAWVNPAAMPAGWSSDAQLANVPKAYL